MEIIYLIRIFSQVGYIYDIAAVFILERKHSLLATILDKIYEKLGRRVYDHPCVSDMKLEQLRILSRFEKSVLS